MIWGHTIISLKLEDAEVVKFEVGITSTEISIKQVIFRRPEMSLETSFSQCF